MTLLISQGVTDTSGWTLSSSPFPWRPLRPPCSHSHFRLPSTPEHACSLPPPTNLPRSQAPSPAPVYRLSKGTRGDRLALALALLVPFLKHFHWLFSDCLITILTTVDQQ